MAVYMWTLASTSPWDSMSCNGDALTYLFNRAVNYNSVNKASCTAIWQQVLQSVLDLLICGTTDLFIYLYFLLHNVHLFVNLTRYVNKLVKFKDDLKKDFQEKSSREGPMDFIFVKSRGHKNNN